MISWRLRERERVRERESVFVWVWGLQRCWDEDTFIAPESSNSQSPRRRGIAGVVRAEHRGAGVGGGVAQIRKLCGTWRPREDRCAGASLFHYLPTYLPTYQPACLPTYLPTYYPSRLRGLVLRENDNLGLLRNSLRWELTYLIVYFILFYIIFCLFNFVILLKWWPSIWIFKQI
jgi:hypothetical protein